MSRINLKGVLIIQITLSLLINFCSKNIYAQGNIFKNDLSIIKEIRGKVFDGNSIDKNPLINEFSMKINGTELSDAIVEVFDEQFHIIEMVYSDFAGMFMLKNLEYDHFYEVRVSKKSFFSRKFRIDTYSVPDSIKYRKKEYPMYNLTLKLYRNKNLNKENPFNGYSHILNYQILVMR
jgi:hypothetical protein